MGSLSSRHYGPERASLLERVPLNLLARAMLDLDGVAAPRPFAGLAVRSQSRNADWAGEALVTTRIAEGRDLVVEDGSQHVGVVAETLGEVSEEGLKRVRGSADSHHARWFIVDVSTQRMSILARAAGDRIDRSLH